MSSSALTSPAASSPIVANAPAFWFALVGVGILWFLLPTGARPLLIWFVLILLVGLTLVAWPTIKGTIDKACGTGPTTVPTSTTARAAGHAIAF